MVKTECFAAGVLAGILMGFTCAQFTPATRSGASPDPTVLITNSGIDALSIYLAGEPTRRAWLQPGETRCVHLHSLPALQHQLLAKAVGNAVAFSPQVDLRNSAGWAWNVQANLPTPWLAGQELVPREPCKD